MPPLQKKRNVFGNLQTPICRAGQIFLSGRRGGKKQSEAGRLRSEGYMKQNMDCSAWSISSWMDSCGSWAMAIPLAQENPSRERYSRQIS